MPNPAQVLGQPLTLPCGAVLANRIMKSATSEALGDRDHGAGPGLPVLYRTLAQGGAGLIVTGNVMVDHRQLGEPGNVVVVDETRLDALARWAVAGTSGAGQLWVQINHPGRQVPKMLFQDPVGPSAVPFAPAMQRFFATPRALAEAEIADIVRRFGEAARIAKKAGFTGVQIHGAHGYLVSQFLSPHTNRRTDPWGGAIQNRMRFLLEIYAAIRDAVGDAFPVGVKLNSADFQFKGFSEDDAVIVCRALEKEGVDLIEISGGSYESPAMTGRKAPEKVRAREAYFLDFARRVRREIACPLALTGGFRTAEGMARAVESGDVDLTGLARSLCVDPDMPKKILAGEPYESPVRPIRTGVKALDNAAMLEVAWYGLQLSRMARGKKPHPRENPWIGLAKVLGKNGFSAFRRKREK
ncbi:MAG: NADH:flavin oxidoreductase/NADH oxidase family protein [Proteobacteria bacterium]|nr:NADH:flavin oxidoreductase/NADH oxidase family protein [Pseudomonadota bacterium]